MDVLPLIKVINFHVLMLFLCNYLLNGSEVREVFSNTIAGSD